MTQIRARTPTPSRPDQGPAPRLEPKASVRLTGRGAIAALFALCFGTQLLTAPGTFLAAEGILVTLGTSAPWLFTGTALTVVVAIGRGYRPFFRPAGGSASRGRTGGPGGR